MDVPLCDLREANDPSGDTLRLWERAAVEVGCFGLVNHGIPTGAIEACVSASKSFYERDGAWKQRYAMARSLGNRGYIPDDVRPAGTDRVVRDYASLDLGPELVTDPKDLRSILLGPNRWPDLPGFRTAVTAYWDAIQACAAATSRMLARVCGLDPDHIVHRSQRGCSLLRLLYYPQPARDHDEAPNGHTDYEWLTLIWQSAQGLEILGRDGRVRSVPARPGTIVVLIGDLFEVTSGGYLESTLHWVRSRNPERYSLTFFYGPDYREIVAPMAPLGRHGEERYPRLHAGEHLTALRVRHFAHLRAAVEDGALELPFELPAVNPLKVVKERRLDASRAGRTR